MSLKAYFKKRDFKKTPEADKATRFKPVLVAEVGFTEWTNDGHLRHPVFKGLRLDKKPEQVCREKEII